MTRRTFFVSMQHRGIYIIPTLGFSTATYICTQDYCYTTLIVYVQLTVTCNTRTHTECIVALPLQQWLGERARKFIRS